jgi:hypothetical protein
MLFPQSFIRVWFFLESRLQYICTWWLQVLWKFWIFLNIFEILKFFEIFEILIFLWKQKFLKFWNFFKNFRVFVNRRWSPSVPNKCKTFIQSCLGTTNPRKQFTLPVHSLKNYGPLNSQTTGKEKNSNFNVENFVVMFTYWVTIIAFLFLYKSFKKVYTDV